MEVKENVYGIQHIEMASVQFEKSGMDHSLRYGSPFGNIFSSALRANCWWRSPYIPTQLTAVHTPMLVSHIEYGTVWIRPEYQNT